MGVRVQNNEWKSATQTCERNILVRAYVIPCLYCIQVPLKANMEPQISPTEPWNGKSCSKPTVSTSFGFQPFRGIVLPTLAFFSSGTFSGAEASAWTEESKASITTNRHLSENLSTSILNPQKQWKSTIRFCTVHSSDPTVHSTPPQSTTMYYCIEWINMKTFLIQSLFMRRCIYKLESIQLYSCLSMIIHPVWGGELLYN